MVSIDAMRFDTNGFHIHSETADERVWSTSEGHRFAVRIRPGPATMLTLLRDPDAFAKFRVGVVRSGQALLELVPIQRDGWVLVRIILKGAMDPTSGIGRLYSGHLIIPFHDASITVAVSAYEADVTGVRESEVRAFLDANGELPWKEEALPRQNADGSLGGRRERLDGWLIDPSDPAPRHLARCVADEVRYDSWFPDHPLTRVRAILDQIQGSIQIEPGAGAVASFAEKASARWWERWTGRAWWYGSA